MDSVIRWGVTAGSHDAAIAVFDNNKLLYATHAERTSGIKGDKNLNKEMVEEAMHYGYPDEIHWYENDMLKRVRQLTAGQFRSAIMRPAPRALLEPYFPARNLKRVKIIQHNHHKAHASLGYYTSDFAKYNEKTAVLVVDSIGEFDTITIWKGQNNNLSKLYSQGYPNSLGLFYSAMTQRVGLKPNEEEFILMGWAASGHPNRSEQLADSIFEELFHPLKTYDPTVKLKKNLHRGMPSDIDSELNSMAWRYWLNKVDDYADLARATQIIYERVFEHLLQCAKHLTGADNIVLAGGSTLNCQANTLAYNHFDNVYVSPNPGDAGNAIGAVLDETKTCINYSPYLGDICIYGMKDMLKKMKIHERANMDYLKYQPYPIESIIDKLIDNGLTGIIYGRTEFGPRALGNRSILADPRNNFMKSSINALKKRQGYRPFAPIIREEIVHEHFDLEHIMDKDRSAACMNHITSPYMSLVMRLKEPKDFPAIAHAHIDKNGNRYSTSRVQTVSKEQNPGLHRLLEQWEELTGCPMILNTSLNVKGMPMANNLEAAKRCKNSAEDDTLRLELPIITGFDTEL
jgi:carbamoyltransferase